MSNSTKNMSFPFGIPIEGSAFSQHFKRQFYPLLEKMLGITQFNEVYKNLTHCATFEELICEFFQNNSIIIKTKPEELNHIVSQGPAVVVANHPLGIIDGLILYYIFFAKRQDIKFLANYQLSTIHYLQNYLISVDPLAKDSQCKMNFKGLREALNCLKQGNMLMSFPAGQVAHLSLKNRKITDPDWNITIAKIIRCARVSVIPVHIDGCNSLLFQMAGIIHPKLRTALLPSETIKKKNCTINVHIGKPIYYQQLEKMENDLGIINFLRQCTYQLPMINTRNQGSEYEVTSNYP